MLRTGNNESKAMKRTFTGLSILLSIICLISCRQSPSENNTVLSENDSITLVDTFSFMQPTPTFHYRDSLVSKKYHKKELSKEYVTRSRVEKDWEKKNWYLNQAIELDSLNAEAYYERGVLKTTLEGSFPPMSGCPDFCRAKKLGFPVPNGPSIFPDCDCKE